MLKSDLLRVRRIGDAVKPTYVKSNNRDFQDRAAQAISIFAENVGNRRLELDEELAAFQNGKGDKRIAKGLISILEGMCEFESLSDTDPIAVRRFLFEASAESFPVGTTETSGRRGAILEACAEHFEIPLQSVEEAMFADLKDQQRLVRFKEPTVEALVNRYNVAQAQGLLLTAYHLRIRLPRTEPARLRQLLRYLKFFQLLFRAEYDGTSLEIRVDGPKSVLTQTRAYGMKLASFLPALLLLEHFELEAPVLWKRKKSLFRLSHKDELISHYRDRGAWIPKEFSGFLERLEGSLDSDLKVTQPDEVFSLGGRDFYVPDIAFSNGIETVATLEIIWPWRKMAFGNYYELFKRHAPDNALLMVSQKTATATFLKRCKDPRIISYRKTPLAPSVLKAIKAVAKKDG